MPNFEGSDKAVPQVAVLVETRSRGASVPGGVRTAALMGEGLRSERIISSAVGNGNDGLNAAYSNTNGRDGRHFALSNAPLVTNRSTVFKNGLPLVGVEQSFTSSSGSFSSRYDYRMNIENGRIELQTASLIDQGGTFYSVGSLNQGTGSISSLSLIDPNAPTETWTVKCASVRRDGYGEPIDGYAKFIAQGSISGLILDGYGNQITWQSNGTTNDNTILQFAIAEGVTKFREGDKFTVKVKSGVLSRGDSLTVNYIAEADLNDPQFFNDIDLLVAKHGSPSLTNRLSLGAQIAFANSPPGVWAVQTAPAIPRRVSYALEASASGGAAADDLQFNLPLNVLPDADTNINFFVTDLATEVETQIFPNKVDFYDASYTTSPNSFHFGSVDFSYTVVLEDAVIKEGDDGEVTSIGPSSATISSSTVVFDSGDVGKELRILAPAINNGSYTIASVVNGIATISGGSFTDTTEAEFVVIDDSLQTAKILFTDDLALAAGNSLRATVVDEKDASFFDPNWTSAYEALETIECDIVVPLPSQTMSSIFQAGLAHVTSMSNTKNRRERVLFTGAMQGLTPENVLGTEDAAPEDIGILEGIQGDSVSEILAGDIEDLADYSVVNTWGGTFRAAYFYPDQIVVQIGADRVLVDGFFMAAAGAGLLSAIPNIAVPLTNKNLAGFTILRNRLFRPSVIEDLAAAGILVVQPVTGGGRVTWGKTTTQSGFVEEQELSIVFIRDRVAKILRQGFAGFIGNPADRGIIGTLMARANTLAQGMVSQGLITKFQNIRVIRDPSDPGQYNVSMSVEPVYAVNWIVVKVDVGVL